MVSLSSETNAKERGAYMPAAQELLTSAFNDYVKKTGDSDVAKIAKACGLSYSTVYNPLFKGRKAGSEVWFKIMQALGAIESDADGIHIKRVS